MIYHQSSTNMTTVLYLDLKKSPPPPQMSSKQCLYISLFVFLQTKQHFYLACDIQVYTNIKTRNIARYDGLRDPWYVSPGAVNSDMTCFVGEGKKTLSLV